jgi:rod shape determining protein RodA
MATRVAQTAARTHLSADVAHFLRHVDYLLIASVGALIAYGLWVLESVSRDDVAGDPNYYVFRQGINIALGVVAFALATAINPELYRRYRTALYGSAIFLMATVFAVGAAARGSRRWIEIGFFRFQPSELGKLLLVLFLAGFVADRVRRIGEGRTTMTALGLAALPTLLVFLEPDFGTSIIYGGIVLAALFLAGTRWLHLGFLAAGGAVAGLVVLWALPAGGVDVLKPYQAQRLTGFINPDLDPSGATYNVTQSITAVGSGGIDGRGVAGATQTKLNYLPEHATDFIFSSLAEQRGFLGASLLLLLYALVAWRGIKIVALAPSLFTAVTAGAIVFAFLLQVFVNIGMTIGIAPITGIPLPFVSYGGSSMIVSLLMMGILSAIHVRGRIAGRS